MSKWRSFANSGEPVGYFPFQRTARNVGIPVGGSLNDFQGVVARPGFSVRCRCLGPRLPAVGLAVHAIAGIATALSAAPLACQRFTLHGSPRWIRCLLPPAPRGGQPVHFADRRETRAHGDSRLGAAALRGRCQDPRVLESADRMEIAAIRADPRRQSADQARHARFPAAAAGPGRDRNFTACFPRCISAIAWQPYIWACAAATSCTFGFQPITKQLGKYSPGNIYFIEQAAAAESLAIQRIDLGCGNEKFKTSLRSFGTQVAEGAVGLGAALDLGATHLAAHETVGAVFPFPRSGAGRRARHAGPISLWTKP